MRVLRAHRLTGPSGLRFEQVPAPPARPGWVRVAVHAAGVGFADTLATRGMFECARVLPLVPGREISGRVIQAPVGSGFAVGDRVAGVVPGGGFADLAWVDPGMLAVIPARLTFVQAAAMVLNHPAALFALTRCARPRAGELVVVHGAGGGLGSAAVQIARALGARVAAVAGSPARRALAATAGADVVCGPEDWFDAVRAAGGADVVIDPVGGVVFEASVRVLAPGGRLVSLGTACGRAGTLRAARLAAGNATVIGLSWPHILAGEPDQAARTAAQLRELVAAGLRPLVTGTYDLAEGAQALHALEDRATAGKLVLTSR
jgi:NADPH2:quinone reductase